MTPHVKICGLTRAEDVAAAIEAGADHLGFVLTESPRRVSIETASDLAARARARDPRVVLVGVFVDDTVDVVRDACRRLELDVAQLHGDERPHDVTALADDVVCWKAVRVRDDWSAEDVIVAADRYPSAHAILLDTWSSTEPGGTGRMFRHELAADVARRRRLVLAGGLDASNVADAVARIGPYAVDVSSGVEVAPGVKDAGEIAAFVAAATRGRAR